MNSRIRYYLFLGIFAVISFSLFKCNSLKEANGFYTEKIPFPSDNEMSADKIALGRKLFFDKRLSLNETVSCSSCHIPKLAFSDQKKVSNGIMGRITDRNSPSILNSAYLKTVLFDAYLPTLEMQVIVPIQEHVEMGMDMIALMKRLQAIDEYRLAAKSIFNRDFDPWVLTRSIAAFERSLLSNNSRFDQYYYQNKKEKLSESEKEGWKIFSKKLYCTECHPAPFFTTFLPDKNGVYQDINKDKGRYRVTNDSNDIGNFKIPSLRNVELTFPYMHNGSYQNIEEVIRHYSKGGKDNTFSNPIITPFKLSEKEIKNLKAFLFSLTDTSYMKDFN